MKKIITSVAALLVMGSVSFAQDAPKAHAKKSATKATAAKDAKMAPAAKADNKMAPAAKADKKMDAKKK